MKNPQSTSETTQNRPVPLLDISRQNQPLEDEIMAAIESICKSGQFVLGPEVTRLEERIAQYCDTKFAIGCASGTDALLLSMMAIDIGPGDEVILPSFTFFATASCVTRLGATPVFVDIDPDTFNLDPKEVASSVTSKTRAIIPVHLFGQPAEMDEIMEIAKKHDLDVVEDAAQAIGAEYHGRKVGSIGEVGCISFYPTKNLGCFGDGGMITTSDPHLAKRMRELRAHGMEKRYHHHEIGINSRLDSIQAAVLNIKLDHLDSWGDARAANATKYDQFFKKRNLNSRVTLPKIDNSVKHVWNQFAITVPDGQRDALRAHLTANRIGSEIYYPIPLHRQESLAYLNYKSGTLPNTEQAADEILNLPIFAELQDDEIESVVDGISNFYSSTQSVAA